MNAQELSTDGGYDVAVIGGGPVGAALALACKDSGLKICVLEARPADTASRDARALALSYGSRLLLERLGVWGRLQQVSSISTIHISQKQSFGRAVLRATELNVPELGYVLPYPELQDALSDALKNCPIDVIYGANVTALEGEAGRARITYLQDSVEQHIEARLAVVADGGRLLAKLHPPKIHDYHQCALITHVTCAAPRVGTAFERFTPEGPVALLPYRDGYELVWTASPERAEQMLAWDDATFLTRLHEHFGDRVGEFLTADTRTTFPLGLRRAKDLSPMTHTVLLGNAAQTMHPVAGQGFNMGLRDAWELAQQILDSAPDNLGTDQMLAGYRGARRLDREAGIRFTDGLVNLFSNDLPLVGGARAAMLSALDCVPFAKRFVAKRMMFGANG